MGESPEHGERDQLGVAFLLLSDILAVGQLPLAVPGQGQRTPCSEAAQENSQGSPFLPRPVLTGLCLLSLSCAVPAREWFPTAMGRVRWDIRRKYSSLCGC